jgi:hypothetical protein
MFARLTKMEINDMAEHLLEMGIERLTLELLKRQLDDEQGLDPDALHTCPVCKTLVDNLLAGGSDHYAVSIDLKRPVVGIGAPIHFFLPRAAEVLGAEAVLPADADVANAIGAITSDVVVKRQVRIIADQEGGFLIEGLAGARHFQKFDEADSAARTELCSTVRDLARAAGTSVQAVELKTEDKLSKAADGNQIFLGRTIYAKLSGRPDMVIKSQAHNLAAVAN